MKKYLWLCFVLMIIAPPCYAEDLYVRSAAGGEYGLEDGSSWDNAFDGFTDISWGAGAGAVGPGDTLYISGGAVSETYAERLVVGTTGTVGNIITIKIGQDAGYNGQAILTSPDWAHDLNDKSYITISGKGSGETKRIRMTGTPSHGITLQGTTDNVILEYLEIDTNGDGADEHGVYISHDTQPSSIEIRYCDVHDNYQDAFGMESAAWADNGFDKITIHHCDIYNVHDDGVACWLSGLTFRDNTLRDRIIPHRGHPDGLQLYGTHLKVYNNLFKDWYVAGDDVGGPGGLYVVYIETDGGDDEKITWDPSYIYIYNNVFVETVAYGGGNDFSSIGISLAFSDNDFTAVDNIIVANNYFIGDYDEAILTGWAGSTLDKGDVTNFFIVNNIFENASRNTYALALTIPANAGGADVTYGSYGDGDSIVVDYDLLYGDGSSHVYYDAGIITYADFKTATGCQDTEFTADPQVDVNYRPIAGSPCLNVAKDLAVYFTTDKDGNTRPCGAAWDIGAYEYCAQTVQVGTGPNSISVGEGPNVFSTN